MKLSMKLFVTALAITGMAAATVAHAGPMVTVIFKNNGTADVTYKVITTTKVTPTRSPILNRSRLLKKENQTLAALKILSAQMLTPQTSVIESGPRSAFSAQPWSLRIII